MTLPDFGIIGATTKRNAPAVLDIPRGVTLQIGPVMLNHSTTTPAEQFKKCVRCEMVLPLSSFYASPRNKAKKRPHCKACHLAGATPESRWQVMTKGMRKRLGYAPSVPDLRESLGEPTCCYLCGDQLGWDEAVVDHILPISRGGNHDLDNLKWTHRRCNSAKGDMTLYELSQLSEKISGHLPDVIAAAKEAFGEFATLNLVGAEND